MKPSSLLASLTAGFLAGVSAGPSTQPREPRVVRLDMYKNPSDPIRDHLRRKRDTVQAPLENEVRTPNSHSSCLTHIIHTSNILFHCN